MNSDDEVSPGAVRQVRETWEYKTSQVLGPRWDSAFADWIKKFGIARVTDAVQRVSLVRYSEAGERIAPDVRDVPAYAKVEQADDEEPGMRECYYVRGLMRVKFFHADDSDRDILSLLRRALRAGVSTSAMYRAVEENNTLEDCFVSLGVDRFEFRIAMGQSVGNATAVTQFFVREQDPEWPLWNEHWRKTKGVGAPMNKQFGWYFPSRLPPVIPPPKVSRGRSVRSS
ncbi:hypothetical protein [Rhodopseudomonas sp. RCAM05734]|uniref:hypothetical protein n=1 Tax=Rhodopseudomonas sp. RCAM05734 TaxID=3457549 RepID=UPI0040445E91